MSGDNTMQPRGLVDASSIFFTRAVSVGRTVDQEGTESALLVVAGNFGDDDETITLNVSVALRSWPQFVDMINRFEEVGKPPRPVSESEECKHGLDAHCRSCKSPVRKRKTERVMTTFTAPSDDVQCGECNLPIHEGQTTVKTSFNRTLHRWCFA
jgi:hypothetical protein